MAAILVFFCLLRQISPCGFVLKLETQKKIFPVSEATRGNLQVNTRILKWRASWNKLYDDFGVLERFSSVYLTINLTCQTISNRSETETNKLKVIA